jgi:hypothetical protein
MGILQNSNMNNESAAEKLAMAADMKDYASVSRTPSEGDPDDIVDDEEEALAPPPPGSPSPRMRDFSLR